MKIFGVTMLAVCLLLGSAGCSDRHAPERPTAERVLRDVQAAATNIYLGKVAGKDENVLLTPLAIDDSEMEWTKGGKKTIDVKITASIGDRQWRSESKHTITVHYGLDASQEWKLQGLDVLDPVIRVVPRTAP